MPEGSITLALVDGARVVVPDSLELITPYVLQEQHDWFEDEIRFARLLLQPGDHAIDVGANYGVYTVSMARAVGPEGHVWAFEPASHPASFLAQSIAANGYENVTLERSALSRTAGHAHLTAREQSELNTLCVESPGGETVQRVRVSTLDECLSMHAWQRIDFVKIDAEGEEANIVAGGARFFDAVSPLVQYEVRAGDVLHLELVDSFAALGYASYRLVPALNVLVPFDAGAAADPLLLNLFACQPGRAEALARRALLVPATAPPSVGAAPHDPVALHALSRDSAAPMTSRLRALEASVRGFALACETRATPLRLAGLARAALDYGSWQLAWNTLSSLCEKLFAVQTVQADEPFVAPSPRFDAVERTGPLREWLLAAALDAFDRAGSFSSYFDPESAPARLGLIAELGYGDANITHRLHLLERRAAAARAIRGA